jgi:hypothetical protein
MRSARHCIQISRQAFYPGLSHPKFQLLIKTTLSLIALLSMCIGARAQGYPGGFGQVWGGKYSAPERTTAAPLTKTQEATATSTSTDPIHRWNQIAIDASGLDHTPVAAGENRVFGEQLGPTRASRAIAIVQIAVFDAENAIYRGYRGYADREIAPRGASEEAAVAMAAHDTLVALFPSQQSRFDQFLASDLFAIPNGTSKNNGVALGRRAASAILALRANDGSGRPEPRVGIEFIPSNAPGKWRQDPISQLPLALGAYWGRVKPFVMKSGSQFRLPAPPALTSSAYAAAYNDVKALGGDGITTPTTRTDEQTNIGYYWAYDGTPSLCAPPRLYNQLMITIADQMGTHGIQLARLLALGNVAMADAAIAIWESKFYYQLWRPVTGIREGDPGTGPTGIGDRNSATEGDTSFSPLGAPASNLNGPNFTPPFPSYPSGHAGFGGALFQVLRNFYHTDNVAFTFVSDEFNGVTTYHGEVRPLLPRSFNSFSQAEIENGRSRIYLGTHWQFDATQGIKQGRAVANYVYSNAFTRQ